MSIGSSAGSAACAGRCGAPPRRSARPQAGSSRAPAPPAAAAVLARKSRRRSVPSGSRAISRSRVSGSESSPRSKKSEWSAGRRIIWSSTSTFSQSKTPSSIWSASTVSSPRPAVDLVRRCHRGRGSRRRPCRRGSRRTPVPLLMKSSPAPPIDEVTALARAQDVVAALADQLVAVLRADQLVVAAACP